MKPQALPEFRFTSRRIKPACTLSFSAAAALLLLSHAPAGAATLLWQGAGASTTWDVGVSFSWLDGGTPSVFANGDQVTFDDSAVSLSPIVSTVVQPGSITVSGTNNFQFSGVGRIDGVTGLRKEGTGILTIANSNSFSGPVVVDNGVLRYGVAGALGTSASQYIYATNNGSLDLNNIDAGSRTIGVAGSGYQGAGAIMNSPTDTTLKDLVGSLEFIGDATLGSSGRWNIKTGGTVLGKGHNLTKVGIGQLWLYRCGQTGLGDIEVKEGSLGAYPPLGLGDPSKTLTIQAGATLALWRSTNDLSLFALDKKLVLNGATVSSGFSPASGGSNVFIGPVTLNQTNTFNTSSGDLVLSNSISGSGVIVKAGARTLWLHAPSTYTGPTIVQAGRVILGENATLGAGTLIEVGSGAIIDVSAKAAGLAVGAGQALVGSHNSTIVGSATFQAGSTLSVGKGGPGMVTMDRLSLSGATVKLVLGTDPYDQSGSLSSLIKVNGDLQLSGVTTLVIGNQGALDTTTPYTIAQCSGSLSGGLANLQVVSTNPGYTFSIVDPATTWPSLQIKASGEPIQLLWKGGNASAPNVWDLSMANWINKANSQQSLFYSGSMATFDDTASTGEITVAADMAADMTFNNASLAYVLSGSGVLSGTLTQQGAGLVTLAMTNAPVLRSIVNDAGALLFSAPIGGTTTLAAEISNTDGGMGRIIQGGSNTIVLAGNNLLYSGTIIVTNGVLQYTNLSGLGAPGSTLYLTNNGSLDLNHIDAGLKSIAVSGAGFEGRGAIYHSSTDTGNKGQVGTLAFLGDATLGSSGRWNTRSGGTVQGNGYKMTKVGTGGLWLYNCGETGFGDIEVVAGTLGIYGQTGVGIGDPAKTLTVQPGAAVTFWQDAIPTLDKKLVLNRGAVNSGFTPSAGGSNIFIGPITLNMTNTFTTSSGDLHLSNSISGSGGLIKSGNLALYLHAPNTYTGPTTINASGGKLVLGAQSSLASQIIQVGSSSTLDVSAPAAFALGGGQVLGGAGTIAGGNVVIGPGATLLTGMNDNTVGTLTMSGSLVLQAGGTNRVVVNKTSTTISNNKIAGLASVQIGGTLAIVNIGNPLAVGDAMTLFDAGSWTGTGFESITPATPGPGLDWDTSTLLADGKLRVKVGATPPPATITAQVANQQITLSWPAGLGWLLQAQTNAPGNGLGSGWIDVQGSSTNAEMTFPIDPTVGSTFYRLIYR